MHTEGWPVPGSLRLAATRTTLLSKVFFPQTPGRRGALRRTFPLHTSVSNYLLFLHQAAQSDGENEGLPGLLGGLTSFQANGGNGGPSNIWRRQRTWQPSREGKNHPVIHTVTGIGEPEINKTLFSFLGISQPSCPGNSTAVTRLRWRLCGAVSDSALSPLGSVCVLHTI